MSTGERVERALRSAGLSQRAAAAATGISQPTLHRILTGERHAKVPELIAIAVATGLPPAEILGESAVSQRVRCSARATGSSTMEEMRAQLLRFLELDAYLDDQGIAPAAC